MKALVLFSACLLAALAAGPARAQDAAAIERGKYLCTAAGCEGCHTDTKNKGQPLAGGRALATPFGIYYGPNITADKQHGIGNWTDADFIRALREGVSPAGEHYFPVFPYTSFTKMTDRDMLDIKAYILSMPAVAKADIPHDIKFPFGFRFTMIGWKMLFLDQGAFKADPKQSQAVNRGAYITQALAHCGECHSPRNFMGAVKKDLALAGSSVGPDGDSVPNITPHPDTGIGSWSEEEIVEALTSGFTPNDVLAGAMAEVVQNTSKLTPDDRAAIAAYLKSLPPIPTQARK